MSASVYPSPRITMLNRFAGSPVTRTGTTLALPTSSADATPAGTTNTDDAATTTAAITRLSMKDPPTGYLSNEVDHRLRRPTTEPTRPRCAHGVPAEATGGPAWPRTAGHADEAVRGRDVRRARDRPERRRLLLGLRSRAW